VYLIITVHVTTKIKELECTLPDILVSVKKQKMGQHSDAVARTKITVTSLFAQNGWVKTVPRLWW
jgi:hypothetical protein